MKEEEYYILYSKKELDTLFFKDREGDYWFSKSYRDNYDNDTSIPPTSEGINIDCFEYDEFMWTAYYPKSAYPKNLPSWVIKHIGTKSEYPEYFL